MSILIEINEKSPRVNIRYLKHRHAFKIKGFRFKLTYHAIKIDHLADFKHHDGISV